MSRCRSCAGEATEFLAFGRMPIANAFLAEDDFPGEYFQDLAVVFCERCAMPQLAEAIPAERLFHGSYPFFTSSSSAMTAHFARLAAHVRERWLGGQDPLVVEIGSNDGTLLRHFAAAGTRHLGVEPSANVARVAAEQGVATLQRFFDEDSAREVVRAHGTADLVLSANCFCHVADLGSLGRALDLILSARGVVVFEDPYVGDILGQTAFDQFYDEHVVYFSATSVSRWLAAHGLEIVEVDRQATHGGSMRYTVGRNGIHAVAEGVRALLAAESAAGLDRPEAYGRLGARVERSRDALFALLTDAKRQGKRVVGYGATSKSTTVLNYCGIGADLVEFISDTTPLKQGKYSPGVHIPVRPPSEFRGRYPDLALLFAWNHAEEILAKEAAFARAGGRWIVYVPDVRLLG